LTKSREKRVKSKGRQENEREQGAMADEDNYGCRTALIA
jgi:hypothetical protein